MSSEQKSPVTHQNVPCPFCSLLCDDLTIREHNGKVKVTAKGCARAIMQFERERPLQQPLIKGKKCTLEEAIEQAARILRNSRQPLFTGLGTDVNGLRAVMALAEHTGGVVDHMHGNALMHNISVLQDQGWMMTTFAEVKNRADLILCVGVNPAVNYPRFFERMVHAGYSLNQLRHRQLVFLGEEQQDIMSAGRNKGITPFFLQCRKKYLGEVIATVHALAVGRTITRTSIAGIPLVQLKKLAKMLMDARYGVIVWAPGELLDIAHPELAIQSLCELVKYLNRTTRFAGLSLGGNDGGASAVNVCAWQSGYPLRVSFATGPPAYNPYRYSTKEVLRKHGVDALVWVSSFGSEKKPPAAAIPSIILADHKPSTDRVPDVFVPVGTPGVHHVGQLIRADNVVSLRLQGITQNPYASTAGVLDQVLQKLRAG